MMSRRLLKFALLALLLFHIHAKTADSESRLQARQILGAEISRSECLVVRRKIGEHVFPLQSLRIPYGS
jgi:hypothetical protein